MSQKNHVAIDTEQGSPAKRMMIGGGLALILIGTFLSGVNGADPAWGRFWMIRPLIVVPVAGALGGACYHYLQVFRREFNWKAAVTIPLGVLIYIIGLWLGTVLGLNGTLWN